MLGQVLQLNKSELMWDFCVQYATIAQMKQIAYKYSSRALEFSAGSDCYAILLTQKQKHYKA